MLRDAQALARWLSALLGVLALVTTVMTVVPAAPCEPDGTTCLEQDRSAPWALGVDIDASREASEGRNDDERDEEDPSDPDALVDRHGVGPAQRARLGTAARAPTGEGHPHGSDRAAHRDTPERPPHA